jgi:phosphatidylserine decarboxylase
MAKSETPNWLRILRVWLFTALPHHLISRVVFYLTRIESSLASIAINWFIRRFQVDMSDAAIEDINAYPSFNAFFVRELKPGARPVAAAPNLLVSPVDGRVSQIGNIMQGHLFQAKGHFYSSEDLLGGDRLLANMFEGGRFATIYLAPNNYHRIHMPLDGQLKKMIHVPGRLFSVAPWTVNDVPRLFARNERLICLFSTTVGPMALILVGAINVAAIETVWSGLVTPPAGKKVSEFNFEHTDKRYAKGEEIARFNMGSTVILLTSDKVHWGKMEEHQPLRMGQAIAKLGTLRTAKSPQ